LLTITVATSLIIYKHETIQINRKVREYDQLLNNSIEKLYFEFKVNGSEIDFGTQVIDENGHKGTLREFLGSDTVFVFYYDINMCSKCYENGLVSLSRISKEYNKENIIISGQFNHREFSNSLSKLELSNYFSIPSGTKLILSENQLSKPIFFTFINGIIEDSFYFDNKIPFRLLESYFKFRYNKYYPNQ
jgi:hypothetical protein